MSSDKKTKADCIKSFAACWELAKNQQASAEQILWLKENYENLCMSSRWGIPGIQTEFQWNLDDHFRESPYFEESLWSNPNMPSEELEAEFENADDTQHIEAILMNPSCPESILIEASKIDFDDRDWIEEVSEEDVEEIRLLAQSKLS